MDAQRYIFFCRKKLLGRLFKSFLANTLVRLIFSANLVLGIVIATSAIKIMPDQAQKNRPMTPGPSGGGDGPSAPKVEKPNTEELLKRMRKVDPDQAKRYRQRTGQ